MAMMKGMFMKASLLVVIVLSGAGLVAADALPDGFRGVRWGAPLATVTVTAPDKELSRSATAISGSCVLAERPFRFVYLGKDGRLGRGLYIHDEHHVDSNVDVAIFDELKKILTDKYGPPTTNDELWSNELFKGDKSKLGTALAVEAVVLRAQWNDGHNYITLQAKGKNINIAVTVAYGKVAELTDEVVSADDSADRSKL
jgi:DNA-binding protein